MIDRPFSPPDREMWSELRRAIGEVPMSLSAHQSVQRIFDHVESESLARAAREQALQQADSTERA